MRRVAFKPVLIVMMAAAVFGVFGCSSSSDPLDEIGQRYTASIAIQDLDEETLTVDVIQSSCEGEAEDYGPASAAVSFSVVDENALGITLKGYSLEYIPLESEDGTGAVVMPPTLDGPLNGGNLGIDIEAGGSAEFEITCMSTETKEEFRRKNGWLLGYETAEGQADLAAIDGEIVTVETNIAAVEAAILVAPDEATLGILETQLATLNGQLETLIGEYWTVYYSFYQIPELTEARYLIRITFDFEDTAGNSRTIVREATVWLGPYDNC